MTPISHSPATISLTSGKDTIRKHTIQRAEVDIPYIIIGSFQSLTGSMEKEISVKEEAITNWGVSLQTSTVYPNMVHKAYKTILIPKIGFSLTSKTLTTKQLQYLQIKADSFYIPKLGFSSKFPKVILCASHIFGGFNQSVLQMTQIYKELQMTIGST